MNRKFFHATIILLVSIIIFTLGQTLYIHLALSASINPYIFTAFLGAIMICFSFLYLRLSNTRTITDEEISNQPFLPDDYKPSRLTDKGLVPVEDPQFKDLEEEPSFKTKVESLPESSESLDDKIIKAKKEAELERINLQKAAYQHVKQQIEKDEITVEPSEDLLSTDGPKANPVILKTKKTVEKSSQQLEEQKPEENEGVPM